MQSDPIKPRSSSFDQESMFIAGNLDQQARDVHDMFSDDESDNEDNVDDKFEDGNFEDENFGSTNFKRADDILFATFGIRVLETVSGFIVNGKLN